MSEPQPRKRIISDAVNALNVGVRYAAYLNPLRFRQHGTRAKAYIALALVCFFWGTTWIASREGVQHMPAIQMAGIRQLLGGSCYVIFFLIKGAPFPKGREWWPILALSILNFVLSNTLSTWGVKYISAGLGSIIGAIFPLWLVIIGLFGSKTALKRRTVAGLLLGFTGICVIFYQHLDDFWEAKFRFGILLSLASTWSWAFGTLFTKKQAMVFNPYFSLGLQMVISGSALTLGSWLLGASVPIQSIPVQSWLAIAYLVVFGSVISFIAYLYALQHLSTETASLYAYINPIVAVLLAPLFFANEHLTLPIILGVVITLYGVYMVKRERE